MMKWTDLIIDNISEEDSGLWLQEWKQSITGPVHPVFMSRFGDWFLRRPDGSTDELSVIEGTVETIASSPEEFAALVNSPEWQEEHLLSYQVFELHEQGIVPGDRQCYGFSPHPLLSGEIDTKQAMVFDIPVWQSICAQTIGTLTQILE